MFLSSFWTDLSAPLVVQAPNSALLGFRLKGRGMNKKSTMLADLFRPPLEVLFKGTFEKARSTAAKQQRWLLLNLQDPGVFDCQLLNRDTWSDEGVKALIKASFIMIQLYNTSDQATEYTYAPTKLFTLSFGSNGTASRPLHLLLVGF